MKLKGGTYTMSSQCLSMFRNPQDYGLNADEFSNLNFEQYATDKVGGGYKKKTTKKMPTRGYIEKGKSKSRGEYIDMEAKARERVNDPEKKNKENRENYRKETGWVNKPLKKGGKINKRRGNIKSKILQKNIKYKKQIKIIKKNIKELKKNKNNKDIIIIKKKLIKKILIKINKGKEKIKKENVKIKKEKVKIKKGKVTIKKVIKKGGGVLGDYVKSLQ